MATPRQQVSGLNASCAQRLRSDGTDTSILLTVSATDPWSASQKGVAKFNTGESSEWVPFTAVTINSSTSVTLTGCTRGLDKDATSLTDATSTNKKNHPIGTPVRIVLHSADINKYTQNDADNTISGDNTLTGSNVCSSTTKAVFTFQNVTTAQRTGLTGLGNGVIVYDSDLGEHYQYSGGAWSAVSAGSTQPNASTSVLGKVKMSTAPADPANPIAVGDNDTRIMSAGTITDLTDGGDTTLHYHATDRARSNHTGTQLLATLLETGTAGETLAAGEYVYLKASDGKLYKATNVSSSLNEWNIVGRIVTGGAANATVTYVVPFTGSFFFTSGLTDGAKYYLGTGGALTTTAPAMNSSSTIPVLVGTAAGTFALVYNVQRLQRRTMGNTSISSGVTTTSTLTVGYPIDRVEIDYYMKGGGTYTGAWMAGSGYYDVISGTQQQTSVQGASVGAFVYVIDYADGAGSKTGTASINGSNNIEIAWVESSFSAGNNAIFYLWTAYEKL